MNLFYQISNGKLFIFFNNFMKTKLSFFVFEIKIENNRSFNKLDYIIYWNCLTFKQNLKNLYWYILSLFYG
jgi:hypothetical protein